MVVILAISPTGSPSPRRRWWNNMLTGLIIGMFAGFMLGVLIMSLMVISKRAGRRSEQQGDWLREWLEEDERESFYNVDDMIAFLNAPSAGDRAVAIRRLRDDE